MSTFTFEFYLEGSGDFGCLPVDCEMEYQAASGDGWNEPREPSTVTLCAAHIVSVDGKTKVDIYPAFSGEQVKQIEQAAAVEYDERHRQAEEDHAEERDHDRRFGGEE